MIPKINNILYATDLSKNSAYAFRYAVNSAEHHGADIHILHVLEIRLFPVPLPGGEGTGTLYEGPLYLEKLQKFNAEQRRLAKEKIEKRLKDFCQQELQGNAALLKRVVSSEIVEGDPAGQILQKVDELPADLAIMGTHGKGWLTHAFLGSVAEKVLHRIRIPVFIIPIPEEKDIVIPKINHILYATDLSKNSAYAFRYAINSADKHNAQIHILHVYEKIPSAAHARLWEYIPPEKLEAITKEARENSLSQIKKRLVKFCERELIDKPACLSKVTSVLVEEGDPAGNILQKAEELKADVVVMGSHGKGLLAHAFLGSVAEKVLHRIKIPVLIIPIPQKTDIAFSDI